jgi:hypothetical protein
VTGVSGFSCPLMSKYSVLERLSSQAVVVAQYGAEPLALRDEAILTESKRSLCAAMQKRYVFPLKTDFGASDGSTSIPHTAQSGFASVVTRACV